MPAATDSQSSQAATPAWRTDWDSPKDPGNPHNWHTLTRIYHATIPGLFGFAVTFGTSVYSPAVADVTFQLHASHTVALLGISLYTLGLGFGPIFSAPLSERHGRRVVYIVSAPASMFFTLGAGLSKSMVSLLVCRFFAGLAGSPALAIGAGTNADLFLPHQRAVATSLFLMAPFLGPSLGPVVGGFAAQYKGWKWTQWCILFVALAAFLYSLPMRETYKPVILRHRGQARGLTSLSDETKMGVEKSFLRSLLQNVFRPLHMLFTEPVVFFLSLYTAFTFGILFLFFAAFPVVFSASPYNFSASQTGLTFLGIGLGVLLAGGTGVLMDRLMYQRKHKEALAAGKAHASPEHRLYSAMIGSVGIPIGLFWFGWAAQTRRHWAVLVIAAIPFAWGNLCLFLSAALYIIDVYGPLNGASAIAANGILRYTLGAVFPLFTIHMYKALGAGWATSILGILSSLMLPIPWVLFRWGPRIRRGSRYPVYVS